MNTYGMHSIHGRAPAFATGIKLANPKLEVWLVSGDGDLLSIGGNHTMHVMRRNVDINIMLLNNRIYGLTKGQYSPTSEFGKSTKSTPMGSLDYPVNPLASPSAPAARSWPARIDIDVKHLEEVMLEAASTRGHVLHRDLPGLQHLQPQGLVLRVAEGLASRSTTIVLEHGKPLVFGENRDKGIRFNGHDLEVVTLGNGVTEADLVVHDRYNRGLAFLLARMSHPDFPEARGILFQDPQRRRTSGSFTSRWTSASEERRRRPERAAA